MKNSLESYPKYLSKPKFVLNLHALTETSSVRVLIMTHGVIGNTAGFGPVVLGSSPSGSTKSEWKSQFLLKLGFFIKCPVANTVIIVVYLHH